MCRRLIEQHEFRASVHAHQNAREGKPAKFARTQASRVRVGEVTEAQQGERYACPFLRGRQPGRVAEEFAEYGVFHGVRMLRHPGHAARVDAGDVSPHDDPASVIAQASREHAEHRGLAAATRPVQHRDLSARCHEVQPVDASGVSSRVVDRQSGHPQRSAPAARESAGAGSIENPADATQRIPAVLRSVECGPDVTERCEALGREHEREQTEFERQAAGDQAHADEDGDECDRDRRDQFERERGEKRRAQGLHRLVRYSSEILREGERLLLGAA